MTHHRNVIAGMALAALLCIGGSASAQVVIKGNVYGGGNIGEVVKSSVDGTGNATVVVNGGIVGDKLSLEERQIDANAQVTRVHTGNVYGGGNGYNITGYNNSVPIFNNNDPNGGRVQGNTDVTVKGSAVVRRAVYGGGNIATVGTCTFANTSADVPTYTAGTGTTTVTIQGNALIGPTKDDLTKDDLGSPLSAHAIDTNFKYLGGNEGWVFGGSRGFAGAELKQYSFVDQTIVTVNGDAKVLTVFGGGENGHVKTSTNVTIGGDAIVGGVPLHGPKTTATSTTYAITGTGGPYDGVTVHLKKADGELVEDEYGVGRTIFRGNVFGGGKGTDFISWLQPTTNQYSYTAGRVYGNTTVNIEDDAQIYNRVYGGAPVASVGTFTYASGTQSVIGISSGGNTYVNIKGGTIGSLYVGDDAHLTGLNNGDVYGGGRGLPGRPQKSGETLSPLHQVVDLAYVGHTHVTVEGGNILNSVYGGGANGHVQGNTYVTIKETDATDHPTQIGYALGNWHGNVYAGGGGTARYKEGNKKKFSITAGRVYGNTNLNITGGTIKHNVYGGGALASVGTYLKYNGVERAYFGGGVATLNITGGTIGTDGNENGMVFGSGRGDIMAPDQIMDTLTYMAYTFVNIGKNNNGSYEGDAKINGSVYGSGENGHVYLESHVNVYSGTIGIAAEDYDPDHPDPHFTYRGNVYGAGCGTDKYDSDNDGVGDTYNPNTGYVWGQTEVNIYGGYISRSVYGGGAMGSVGLIDHAQTVKHKYEDHEEEPSLSWPYELTYIPITDSTGATYPSSGNTGKATVNIYGGHIGTLSAPVAESGNVFGSCRGDVGPLGVMDSLAIVRQTVVNIDFTPSVTDYDDVDDDTENVIIGSVYGSGEDGSVYEDTKVTLTNGLIVGSLFGGGSGTSLYKDLLKDPATGEYYEDSTWVRSITAGKVYGNTEVEIIDGYVLHNVYGGGNLASVGKGNYMGYGELSSVTPSSTPYESSGTCTVTIKGGTIGTDGLPDGNGNLNGFVYGSSKGVTFQTVNNPPGTPRYDYSRDFFLGYANKTEVNIGKANTTTAPTIKGSVFGGGDDGHVRWHTNVTVTKGEIGVAYSGDGSYASLDSDDWTYRGNVHGAGRGLEKIVGSTTDYCPSAGSVTLNTNVTVKGGTIHRNVYGGGLLSTIGPPPTGYQAGTSTCYVTIKGGDIGSVVHRDSPYTTDTLYGGYIYGGSRGLFDPDHVNLNCLTSNSFAGVSNTEVSIDSVANVLGNVYGGGELGQVKLETKVYLIRGTTKGSVFGGGMGNVNEVIAGAVKKSTTVDMTGGTVERSIYGGGQMGSVGTFVEATSIQMDYHDDPEDPTSPVIASVKVPTQCESGTGLATVRVKGGFVGKDGSLMPWTNHNPDDDDRGWIFAGGQGIADSITYYNAPALGVVGSTYLEINRATGDTPPDAPVITASVYGGCENGLVLDDTHVVIADGQIGTGYTGNGTTHSWQGTAYTDAQWAAAIAAIGKPDAINSIATQFHECDAWSYTSPYNIYDIFAEEDDHPNNDPNNWDYHLAALVGTDGHSFFGNVFGGGSGYYPIAPGVWRHMAGQVNGNTVVDITGGHILTNVYGGNEMTDVKGTCTVNMSGGTVGMPRTVAQIQAHPNASNIYGAGMGDLRSMFDTYTNVSASTVNVTGGTVFGCVYGGSSEGHVVGHATVTIDEDENKTTSIGTTGLSGYDGLVFGGGKGNAKQLNRIEPGTTPPLKMANFASGRVGGNAKVTMTKGTVLGNLYGGGFVGRVGVGEDGTFDTYITGSVYDSTDVNGGHGLAKVEVRGGYIGNATSNTSSTNNNGYYLLTSDQKSGNVYGGGCGDPNEYIQDDLGRVANSAVEITGNPRIYGSVFGGGQMANAGYWVGYDDGWYADGTSTTVVTIAGTPIIGTELEYNHTYNFPKTDYDTVNHVRTISHTRTGNVYGGGQGNVRLKRTADGQLIGSGYPEGLEHGHCGRTLVYITETSTEQRPTIMSSVYAGSEEGAVWGDTKVKIAGGLIGQEHLVSDSLQDDGTPHNPAKTGSYSYGSVYGASYGMDAYKHLGMHVTDDPIKQRSIDSVNILSGRVYGNTYVEIAGGTIHGNVFGGGDLASVTSYSDAHPGGLCEVKVSGGTIGELDGTGLNAYVFGGGKGFAEDPDELRKRFSNVIRTKVTVEGGKIWGSVFGGGSDAHTLENTEVIVHDGADIGTNGLSTWDGNIFGGGRNYRNTNHTNGRVGGNITITMDGGAIQGTIFGGGRLALAGVDVNGDPFLTTPGGHEYDSVNHGLVTINVSGGYIGNNTGNGYQLLCGSDESVGDIFGSGKGDTKEYDDILGGRVANVKIHVSGNPRIYGSVFGGGEMASIGYWYDNSNHTKTIFYDKCGVSDVIIEGTPEIGTDMEFRHDYAHGTPSYWTVFDDDHNLIHTCTGNVYGGSQGDVDTLDCHWVSMARSQKAYVTINMSNGGIIKSRVFGGSEQGTVAGNTYVTVNGSGTIGSWANTDDDDNEVPATLANNYLFGGVYGGGYGSHNPIFNGTTCHDEHGNIIDIVNDSTTALTALGRPWTADHLAGRTYGNTRVDMLGATVQGDVFGGASYAYIGGYGNSNPYGNAYLNIGYMTTGTDPETGEEIHTYHGNAKILGSVFGANNHSGTPYGNVVVNVYKTAHWDNNFAPETPSPNPPGWTHDQILVNSVTQGYALREVFGGGNHASYTPNKTSDRGHSTNARGATVHIWSCENTIEDLYGGGNAADIGTSDKNADVDLIVDGGRFYRVFSGGNGSSGTPANIYGWANNTINSGVINELYGAGNQAGDILHTNLIINEEPNGCDEFIDNTFGGSNEAPILGDVVTDLRCGEGSAYEFYGGTNNADIYGNVTLNVYGGITENLYGGSKGRAPLTNGPDDPGKAANIRKFPDADYDWAHNTDYPDAVKDYMIAHSPDGNPNHSTLCGHGGNVIVNLYGGTITNVFGGSNINGNIEGTIWVNVIDAENGTCPLDITNLYGGCNATDYVPVGHTASTPVTSPIVNVVHITEHTTAPVTPGYIRHNVFGGSSGNTSDVVANPVVNIGYDATMAGYIPEGYTVKPAAERKAKVAGNVYGGGEEGKVDGSTTVNVYEGEVGLIDYVNKHNSTTPTVLDSIIHLEYDTDLVGGSVFGGGKGCEEDARHGQVKGNSTVNIKGGHVYYSVYGGGELATVGLHDTIWNGSNTEIVDLIPKANSNTGLATVHITGGQVGPAPIKKNNVSTNNDTIVYCGVNGLDGYVFGGGKGNGDDPISLDPTSYHPYGAYYQFANVNNTLVTIDIPMPRDEHPEDSINNRLWGSVFGGAEDGHVLGNTRVNYVSGFMGTHGTTSYDGNIFGGGRNYAHKNYTAGRVAGNTTVVMSGGQLFGNIYGGGRLALTGSRLTGIIPATDPELGDNYYQAMQEGPSHGNTKVVVKGGTIGNNTVLTSGDLLIETFSEYSMGSVYGGGKGTLEGIDIDGHPKASSLLFGMTKNTEVIVKDSVNETTTVSPHIYGIVFGGGEIANVGKYTWKQVGTHISKVDVADEGTATVRISGGTIGADKSKMRYEKGLGDYAMYPRYNDDLGYVYGGGEGYSDDPGRKIAGDSIYHTVNTTRFGNLTLLDVMSSVYKTDVEVSGGWVKASVFGGAESGHVMSDTKVTISGGQIGAGYNGASNPDVFYDDPTVFVNPAMANINTSKYGTYHWDFGRVYHTGDPIDYIPYDPVVVMNDTIPSDGKSWFGNVFGGGSGWFPYITGTGETSDPYKSNWNPISGKVWGNTEVIITDGHILNNVYGGNEATDVGGNTSVTMSGGTIGVPRTYDDINALPTFGYLFGGGCGDPRPALKWLNNVEGSSHVNVTGGIIYGSVYGGAEDGHVLGDAVVNIGQDEGKTTVIGCAGKSKDDGNIFGGGRNYLLKNYTSGRVGGNDTVVMTGGHVLGSIYGGGRNAATGLAEDLILIPETTDSIKALQEDTESLKHGHTVVKVQGGKVGDPRDIERWTATSIGDVYGGGKGSMVGPAGHPAAVPLLISLVKSTEVEISEVDKDDHPTYIYGNVFGGGEVANVGNYTWKQSGLSISKIAMIYGTGKAKVDISGGRIGIDRMTMSYELIRTGPEKYYPATVSCGNVFGGGEGLSVDPTTYCSDPEGNPDINTYLYGNKYLIDLMATVGSTEVTVGTETGKPWVKGSVYGGAAMGHVVGDSEVTIANGQIGAGNSGTADLKYEDSDFFNPTGTAVNADNALKSTYHWDYGEIVGSGSTADTLYRPFDLIAIYNGITGEGRYPQDYGYKPSDGKTWFGNVYGGGSGFLPYIKETSPGVYTEQWNREAGKVYGNSTVTVTGGHILSNVYGGCETSDVGLYQYNNTIHGEELHPDFLNTGTARVTISGGTVGVPRTKQQIKDHPMICYVFGGGKGDSRTYFNTWTNVHDAFVDIKNTDASVPTIIYGSVFGGGEEGHVLGDVDLKVSQATGKTTVIGTLGTSTVDGNIFGGGRGFSGTALTAGTVGGNVDITIKGGTMLGSVYGGGRLGSVGTYLVDATVGSDPNPYYGRIQPYDPDHPNATPDPTINAQHGHITIDIKGGTIGNSTEIPTHDKPVTIGGNVFGGCMGKFIAKKTGDTENPIWPSLARTKYTTVTIDSAAMVKNSVYGGGEIGTVRDSTTVKVKDGIIGGVYHNALTDEDEYCGHVFGGGMGYEKTPLDTQNDSLKPAAYLAGMVYGNTYVTISGGHVYENVYGGGQVASVGRYNITWNNPSNLSSGPSAVTPVPNTGHAKVTVTGGEIGPLDYTGRNAYVFGGSKGGMNDAMKPFGNVNSAEVVMNIPKDADTSYHRVWGSLFGGGSNGHVLGDATVTMKSGTLGTKGRTGYDGNIFTGGRNYYAVSLTAGRVGGNTTCYMMGGHMMGSIFGGGRLGSVGIDVNGEMQEGDAHGYTYVYVGGTVTVGENQIAQENNIYIGHEALNSEDRVGGNVYGGGKGMVAEPGTTDIDPTEAAKVKQTHVYIDQLDGKETFIEGSVFGSGEDGHVLKDTYVNVYNGQIGGHEWVEPGQTPTNCADHFHGNVYGGGRGLDTWEDAEHHLHYSETAGEVYGNTNVFISGGRVCRNVYGGGNLATVGTYPEISVGETGRAKVIITGDAIIGIAPDNENRNGTVFGAGRGQAGHAYKDLSLVRNADVVITGNAKVIGNVYGSGEDGHVIQRTNVFIGDTIIGGQSYNGRDVVIGVNGTENLDGYVFGAGRGLEIDTVTHTYSPTAGIVGVSTKVKINNGTVKNAVFGGGRLASVGHEHALDSVQVGDVYKPIFANIPADFGRATVHITGNATIGVDGASSKGHVFGSGMGELGFADLTYVFETHVKVDGSANVHGSVYGSGQVGHVRTHTVHADTDDKVIDGNTYVTIGGSCNVGIEEDNHVLGGGLGHVNSLTAGKVDGIARVTVKEAATAHGSVAGGGRIALVEDARIVNIDGGMVKRHVLGGNYTIPAAATGTDNKSLKTVNVRDGYIKGGVYGGSYDAVEGNLWSDWSSFVNITGGHIYENVYGAGFGGTVNGSVCINVGLGAVQNAPNKAANLYCKDGLGSSYPARKKLIIDGDVFAGSFQSETGNGEDWDYKYDIKGYSHMYIDGELYNTTSTDTTSAIPYMKLGSGIYGSGNYCESGEKGRDIILRNYGTRTTVGGGGSDQNNMTDATRTLTTLQRAGTVFIDNSNVHFSGTNDISQRESIREYAVLKIDEGLYVANASGIVLGAEGAAACMDSIHDVRSLHLMDGTVYEHQDVTNTTYWEWIGVHKNGADNTPANARLWYSSTHEDPLTPAQENVIIFNADSKLWVRYWDLNETALDKTKYGPLIGFFRMKAEHFTPVGTESFAYARPKLTDKVNPIGGYTTVDNNNVSTGNTWNKGDGGFLSYTTADNFFVDKTNYPTILGYDYPEDGNDGGLDYTNSKQYPYYNIAVGSKGNTNIDMKHYREWVLRTTTAKYWYVDGRTLGSGGWGKDLNHQDMWGHKPDMPKHTITGNGTDAWGVCYDENSTNSSNQHNFDNFDKENDVIFVVGPIESVLENEDLNRWPDYPLMLFRYPGGHLMSNGAKDLTTGTPPVPTAGYNGIKDGIDHSTWTYGATAGPGANKGMMIHVTDSLVLDNVMVNGLYVYNSTDSAQYSIPASYATQKLNVTEPMVVTDVADRSLTLTLKGGTTLQGGYNSTNADVWYTDSDYTPGTGVHHGGALFVAPDIPGTPAKVAKVKVEGVVSVMGNKQYLKIGDATADTIKSNVYLPTFDKALSISNTLHPTGTRIGITSPRRNTADHYLNNTFSPVAAGVRRDSTYVTVGEATVKVANSTIDAQAAWANENFTDDRSWFFTNDHKTTYYTNASEGYLEDSILYFGWTWANVVRSAPGTADYEESSSSITVKSEKGLAWLTAQSAGLSVDATNFSGKTISQTDDLDMKQYVWVPIGTHDDAFVGTYDGKGHLIDNIYVEYIGKNDHVYHRSNYGLFGKVNGTVKRTFVVGGHIHPENHPVSGSRDEEYNIGGLVGQLDGAAAEVINSEAAEKIFCPNYSGTYIVNAGGLVGLMNNGKIHSSMSMSEIAMGAWTQGPVGGLVGKSVAGDIYNSFANVKLSVDGSTRPKTVGGLVGNNINAELINCYVALRNPSGLTADNFGSIAYSNATAANIDKCYVETNSTYSYVHEGNCLTTTCGQYTPVISSDNLGYQYSDNFITGDTTLVARLNENTYHMNYAERPESPNIDSTYAHWARPGIPEINGDLPVLLLGEFDNTDKKAYQGSFRSVGTYAGGPALQYGGPVRDTHELDEALVRPLVKNSSNVDIPDYLFVYSDVESVSTGLSITQSKVSIYEHASILHPGALGKTPTSDGDYTNTYVGISFDNSCSHAYSTPGVNYGMLYMGGYLLPRDWHMFSTPLANAPLGFNYYTNSGATNTNVGCNVTQDYDPVKFHNNPWTNTATEFSWLTAPGSSESNPDAGNRYWMKSYATADGYFPTSRGALFSESEDPDLPKLDMLDKLFIEDSDECPMIENGVPLNRYPYGMDFYTWYEPEYHWVNFKRNGPNHWHSDGWHYHLDYYADLNHYGEESFAYKNVNEETLIPAKGYLGSIAIPTFMQSHGTLNVGTDVSPLTIRLTEEGANLTGWNLVGNPFHGYIDFDEFSSNTNNQTILKTNESSQPFYVVYDADEYQTGHHGSGFLYQPADGSNGGQYAGRYIHPHQGFYVKLNDGITSGGTVGRSLQFSESMLKERADVKSDSHFRGWERDYPLINLNLSSDGGCRDVTVIELDRPEWGGATKLKELRVGNGLFYGHHGDYNYAAMFVEKGTQRVPLWFEAKEDDIYTLTWNTANGTFHSMYLIDNITGIQYDMLRNDTYQFEGHKDDYWSRFYIVFDVTDVDENDDEPFVFFDGSQWVVTGDGDLEVIDVLGHVLKRTNVEGQARISLNNVAEGLYLMRLTSGKQCRIQKVVVTR